MPLGFFEKPRIRSEGHCDLSSCFVLCPGGGACARKACPEKPHPASGEEERGTSRRSRRDVGRAPLGEGGARLRELDLEARPSDEELVAMPQGLFTAHSDEHACARAEVGQDQAARLIFDQAVLFGEQRIVGEPEIPRDGPDL